MCWGERTKRDADRAALTKEHSITASNDVSSRKAQFAQSQWCYSKSFDGACPLGPALLHVSQINRLGDVVIQGQLDGETVQKCSLE